MESGAGDSRTPLVEEMSLNNPPPRLIVFRVSVQFSAVLGAPGNISPVKQRAIPADSKNLQYKPHQHPTV
jgi:hypothetical protein